VCVCVHMNKINIYIHTHTFTHTLIYIYRVNRNGDFIAVPLFSQVAFEFTLSRKQRGVELLPV